jgi:hypothetical protein
MPTYLNFANLPNTTSSNWKDLGVKLLTEMDTRGSTKNTSGEQSAACP